MRKVVHYCDIKSCAGPHARGYNVKTGRSMDAAGSMCDEYYEFDLCPAHAALLLAFILKYLGGRFEVDGARVEKWVKEFGKEAK